MADDNAGEQYERKADGVTRDQAVCISGKRKNTASIAVEQACSDSCINGQLTSLIREVFQCPAQRAKHSIAVIRCMQENARM